MDVHRAGFAQVFHAPHLILDLPPGEHQAGVGEEQAEDFKLLGRQGDFLAVYQGFPLGGRTNSAPARYSLGGSACWERRSTARMREKSSSMPKGLGR